MHPAPSRSHIRVIKIIIHRRQDEGARNRAHVRICSAPALTVLNPIGSLLAMSVDSANTCSVSAHVVCPWWCSSTAG
jgi:hypothetical protein